MLEIIWQTIWLMLPAGIANMAPVLFKWLPLLNYPIDFNCRINNHPILGRNKTWRGLVAGIIMAVFTVYIQKKFSLDHASWNIIDYQKNNVLLLGLIFGLGALGGDMVKSFFKRLYNINPGESWAPFDQIDWILGTLILLSLIQPLSWKIWLSAILIFGIMHPLINLIGYCLKIKKNKF